MDQRRGCACRDAQEQPGPGHARHAAACYARAMPPRLVILDFDGTLADSWPWFRAILPDAMRHFGLAPVTADQAEAMRGEAPRDLLRRLGIPAWKIPAIALHLRRRAQAAPAPPLFPGIPALLHRLRAAGITLAIASSNSASQIARSLGPELDALVAHRALEASLFGKAAHFRRLLRESRIPPAQALAIGDEARDIEAAREAGIGCGAVTWGYTTAARLAAEGPDAIFDTPEAIAAHCGA
jgi:phosphoglycolate phosphatase